MWIVRLALNRPYTFVVFAIIIFLAGITFIVVTPKDIFPNINIPVVSVIWSYAGLPDEEFEQRVTTYSEYSLSNNVNDIERIESQTIDGVGLIRLYFHPGADISVALAQATASSQSILRRMPTGMLPPVIAKYYANTVPLIQMILSSNTLTEEQIYDYGLYRIRRGLATIQGTTLPTPYGGKVRSVMVDVDPKALQATGLSPRDVNNAINNQVLTVPVGDTRIGKFDYRVNANNTPDLVQTINDIPLTVINNVIIYIRDVAHAHDGFLPQTNIVRNDGKRAVLLTILKNGATSTLDIANAIWKLLPTMRASAPKGLSIDLLFDQSVFVKASIKSVVTEGILASILTGLMILLFLGSWRSTLIVLTSIPLSILASITLLSLLGETINVMTLGGLALAIGILVDDATVAIENIHRNLTMGKSLRQAVLDGSYQVTVPAFVSTLSICIVFLPVVLLVGPSKFLFTPFALAVVFAISSSYILSRTVVPVMANYLLEKEMYLYQSKELKTRFDYFHHHFEEKFEQFKNFYQKGLKWSLDNRILTTILFCILFLSGFALLPFVGRDFFPIVDANQIRLHVKAASGTRIEVTEEIFGSVEAEIKNVIPPNEIDMLIDNIGVVADAYSLAFGDNATVSSADGEILIALKKNKSFSTPEYMKKIRTHLEAKFPNLTFFFQPADMVSQILNFGLPTPIDIRIIGYDKKHNLEIAKKIVEDVEKVPGVEDAHLHQIVDMPELFLDFDRNLLQKTGITQRDVMNDVLLTYSSSTVVSPNFWLDRENGIPYLIAVQLPKYKVNSLEGVLNTPVASPLTQQSQLLSNLATIKRRETPGVINHLNVQPVYDVYANVQGRDLGSVVADINKIIARYNNEMQPGNEIVLKGLVENMENAFTRLEIGFIFSIILVYLIMVVNYQSWLDPLVIIMALPGAFAGILWSLFITHTTFSVPSMMGMIMSIGVATANSILLVTFANYQLKTGKNSYEAAIEAATTRLRPILMTSLAMIFGMIPMALALGTGGEQNAPLGRAVIGGLIVATFTTLFFVPVIFTWLIDKPNPYLGKEPDAAPEEIKGSL